MSAAAAGGEEEESEEDRLRLDAEARQRMAEHVKRVEAAAAAAAAAGEEVVDRAAWKWAIRQRIWDLLEKRDLAEEPRPVHHRIPNFKGALEANERIASLPEFQAAKCVKVNPDTPQRHIRFLTLSAGKQLLVPQPRLRTGFFSLLDPDVIPSDEWLAACSSAGVKKHGRPLAIDKPMPPVDLLVIGSVAVDPSTGARLGKGEGFAELEYGIMRMLGVVDDSTLVVTSIRDEQLVSPGSIPLEKLLKHDVPVDIICTPTQVIRTNTKIPKPTGIYWELLSPEKLSSIKVLQQLKAQIETDTGVRLPCGPSEVLPPLATRNGSRARGSPRPRPPSLSREGEQQRPVRSYDLVLRNLPYTITMEEVSAWVVSEGQVQPHYISIRKGKDGRPSGVAFIELKRSDKRKLDVSRLDGRQLGGRSIGANKFEARDPPGAREEE